MKKRIIKFSIPVFFAMLIVSNIVLSKIDGTSNLTINSLLLKLEASATQEEGGGGGNCISGYQLVNSPCPPGSLHDYYRRCVPAGPEFCCDPAWQSFCN
jgi:hypothetical protein